MDEIKNIVAKNITELRIMNNMTQEQLDKTQDTSQIMEFPDYVCQEIINGLVKLVMENASDPRLQTNIPINQTIAPPAQQQQSSK